MLRKIALTMCGLFFASITLADGHGHGHHRHHFSDWHRHGHYQRYYAPAPHIYYREPVRVYPAPIVQYVPVPQAPVYQYDRRNGAGMVGGALGGVMGYQFGGGDPLAAGIGAAAGSWLGNGINR